MPQTFAPSMSADQKLQLDAMWLHYFATRAAALGLPVDPLIGTGPGGDSRFAGLVNETNQMMTVSAYQGALDGQTWGAVGMPFGPPAGSTSPVATPAPGSPSVAVPAGVPAAVAQVVSTVAPALSAAVPALSPALTLLTGMLNAAKL
jgi:hypothetical protein